MVKTKEQKEKAYNHIYQKLLFQLFLYFAFVVCMFAVILSLMYMRLYSENTINSFRISLANKATRISQKVSIYARERDTSGFTAYYEAIGSFFNQEEKTDIYIISNPNSSNRLDDDFTNYNSDSLNSEELPEATLKVLEAAFQGKSASNTGYDEIYCRQVVRVAVPIVDVLGNVSGAIMIMSVPQDQQLVDNSIKYIIISSISALIISFIVSLFIARKFTGPISAMRKVALKLSEGDFEAKTNIHRGGEIGELAKTIDVLSVKLKENEEIRNNMEQTRRDFFANVSHELRTPITVIRGYSEMLADGVCTKEEKKMQYYERMRNECQSMERLVGDLLTLSKMQNPDFEIEKEPVNIVQIFQDIIRGIHVVAAKKNILIEIKYNKDCILMLGDYDRLRQMFLIILDNAIKFSNENSHIEISLDEHTKITVSVTDHGIGISPEELPFIFEKFYKSKLRQNAQGSGLGLVIASQIAKKHNGEIKVESELEKGTTFTFSFDKTSMEML